MTHLSYLGRDRGKEYEGKNENKKKVGRGGLGTLTDGRENGYGGVLV